MLVYGKHACEAALAAGQNKVTKIYVIHGKRAPEWIQQRKAVPTIQLDESEFKKLVPRDATHQGVAVEVEYATKLDISDLAAATSDYKIAVLDNVTDPHNLGAIVRSAATFGIKGIIISEHSSCKITGTVAKTASGGLEHVDIYIVKNLANAIMRLKTYGFWIIAFCESGTQFLHEVDLKGKSCLLFGAEGRGIRPLQMKNSDLIVKLPTSARFTTLNVASTAAIAFYEATRQGMKSQPAKQTDSRTMQ
ncbi:MAG: 23S rRNA (guanosine(2251)-2'-O)-methyltransferase RlmB [Holosporales bacterium]|jgi:23S rRNA (guanosine2251-2'-O)-methyltransferase|nr:23S rRNA (guanosine(2251)-2'-O)-methyltransferase RlmB [Holosporales bacterium]